MNITLFALNGSFSHTALSVRALRAALADGGFAAQIVEGNLRDRTASLLHRLYLQDADVYAFSCYIWNIEQMLALAGDLKALRPNAKIVLGGPEVSFSTERFTDLSFIDHVITGEGEVALPALIGAIAAGRASSKLIAGTPDPRFTERGILYGKNEPVSSLVYYESSRGCPFSCAFCLSGAQGEAHRVRAKSAQRTLADLLEFEDFAGQLTVKLVDRTFNFDRERAKAIWRGLLDPRYTKTYHFEIAAQLLDEESFEILARFPEGKIRLEIGLQSTNEETLAAVSRHTDASAVLRAAERLVRDGGCLVHLDLIAGLPHEGLERFARSFDAAYPACHELQLGFLKFLHGTPLRERAADFGAVFSQTPPYTVLKTDCLSPQELYILHGIDALVDRLRGSGRFANALPFILPRVPSAFAFYRDLDAYLQRVVGKEIQKISQRDLFWHLSHFCHTILPQEDHAALSEVLRADFAAAEVRRPPKGL